MEGININKIQALTEGKNNQNFKVHTESGIFVLKICHSSPAQGINRQIEYSILEKVYHGELGVKPIAFESKTNAIILEFLDVPTWTLPEIRTATALQKFGESIRRIHELSSTNHTYYTADLLDRYCHLLKNDSKVQIFKSFLQITRKKIDRYNQPEDICFCHNDLYYGNFLKAEKIIFLDWEMAGMNDLYADLATFIHFHHLDHQQTKLFLEAYSPQKINIDKLTTHQDAVLLKELLWVISKIQEGCTDFFYFDYYQRCLKATLNRQKILL